MDRRDSYRMHGDARGWSQHAVISAALRKAYSLLPGEPASQLLQRLVEDFRRADT
jgi:hypothetical protein